MRTVATTLAAALVVVSSSARAQSQAPVQGADTKPGEPSPKRALPDYSGLGPEPTDAGDVALWPLRVLLSPLYFTSEYLLRRPLAAIVTAAEKANVPEKLYDFFAFGPDHKMGFAPVGLVEFGFNPSVGIWGFWNDAFAKGNNVFLHFEVWPDDWFAESITDRWDIDSRNTLQLRVSAFKRPDMVFYGLGPESAQFSQSRFTESSFDASARWTTYVWRRTMLETQAGLHKVDLGPGEYGSDPSLDQEARAGVFPVPFGFNRGYLAPYGRVLGAFDTRPRKAKTGSGVRLQAQVEGAGDVEHSPTSGWVRYGGAAAGYVDLNEHGRVLSISAATALRRSARRSPIPFTELVSLGGDNWMHGYFPGRFLDRSAAVAQLQYTWPIAPWVDGSIQGAVGNVFGAHLDGFDPKLLRFSAGVGVSLRRRRSRSSSRPRSAPRRFERGATIDSFRLSFGVPKSF